MPNLRVLMSTIIIGGKPSYPQLTQVYSKIYLKQGGRKLKIKVITHRCLKKHTKIIGEEDLIITKNNPKAAVLASPGRKKKSKEKINGKHLY